MTDNRRLNGTQYTESTKSSPSWIQLTKLEKLDAIESALKTRVEFSELLFQSLSDNGRDLYVGSRRPLATNERGGLLLDLEQFLIDSVDPGLRVWFEVTSDKSKLRQLRGVSPVLREGDTGQ